MPFSLTFRNDQEHYNDKIGRGVRSWVGAEGPDKKRARGSNIVNVLLISCGRELRCASVWIPLCVCVQVFLCAGSCVCVSTNMNSSVRAWCQGTLQLIAGLSDAKDYWLMGEIKKGTAFIIVVLRPTCLMLDWGNPIQGEGKEERGGGQVGGWVSILWGH